MRSVGILCVSRGKEWGSQAVKRKGYICMEIENWKHVHKKITAR